MPEPLVGLLTVLALYAFCLFSSLLMSLLYRLKKDEPSLEQNSSDDEVICIEGVPKRRRGRKRKKTITVRGRIIDENTNKSA